MVNFFISAINPTAVEVTFNKELPEDFAKEDIKVGNLVVKSVKVEDNTAIVTVSGAKYDTAYDVVYGDQTMSVKFGKVEEYFTLKIESDAEDTNNNSIHDIEASGSTTTQLTAYVVDYNGDIVTNYDGKFEFLTTRGSLAQTEVVIQNGKASVQLRSESSLESIYADVTAKVVGGGELAGLTGNIMIEFLPKDASGEAETAVPVVKAQTETADRVQVVLGQPKPGLTKEQLEAVAEATTVIDTVRDAASGGTTVDVKEVRQITDTILELVLDTYSQDNGSYEAEHYLTDNANHTVAFDAVPNVLVATEEPLVFKLTDGSKQVALGATGVDQRTIEVRFHDPVAVDADGTVAHSALNKSNYVLDGKALENDNTTIDLKRDAEGNIVGEGRIVEIKLAPEEAIKKEESILQVRNVGDWAAVTDSKNKIATQDLFLTASIDKTRPQAEVQTESPEQFRLVFDKPVKANGNDLAALIDVRYGKALTKEEAETAVPTTGTPATDAILYNAVKPTEGDLATLLSEKAKTNTGEDNFAPEAADLIAFSALVVKEDGTREVVKAADINSKVEIEEILVELTDDWTKILGADAYWTAAPQIQFKVKRNAFETALGNKNLAFDVVADNNVYDTTSPVAEAVQNKHNVTDANDKVIGQALNEYLDITFDEPVQIAELEKQGTNVPNTPNAKQQDTPQKTDVEFSKDGVVVKGAIYAPEVGDTQFKLTAIGEGSTYNENFTFTEDQDGFAALKAAIEEKNKGLAKDKQLSAAGTWTVKVTGVSDDYGNTMKAQTFNFEVPGDAADIPAVPLEIDPFVVYANYAKDSEENDVITVKFSEVMANAGADGVGVVTNYWINSGQLSADSGVQITKGITGVTEDWDGITITLPKGTIEAEDFMLTVASNLKSADGQKLTRENKLNLKSDGAANGFESSYLPSLTFVNEFDKNAYDVLGKDSTIKDIAKAIIDAGEATTATVSGMDDTEDGFANKVEATITFTEDVTAADTLQVEINGVVGTAKVDNTNKVTVTIEDEDEDTTVQDLELEAGSMIEVKINGQTMFVKAATES